jgi:hypothetical protein
MEYLRKHYKLGRQPISYQDGVDHFTGARIVTFRSNGYRVVITEEEFLMDPEGVYSRVGAYLGTDARRAVSSASGFLREIRIRRRN